MTLWMGRIKEKEHMTKKSKHQVIYRRLSELNKLKNNPRTIKKADMERLKKSVQNNPDYFEARPVILSNRTGELVIIAGNQRYEAAKALHLSEIPTVLLEGLTEEREREIIIRDNVANGDWDMDILANEWDADELKDWGVDLPEWDEDTTEYQKFVDKFKPKLTTDDCFTPPAVFEAVEKWVRDRYDLKSLETIRPFKPEGDYQAENYNGKVVIDNPPFSILSEIVRWYTANHVKFFMFAPHLTILAVAQDCPHTKVVCGANVIYENSAIVSTSFVTNLESRHAILLIAGSLRKAIEDAQPSTPAQLERYQRPKNLRVGTDFTYAARNGVDWTLTDEDAVLIKQSDFLKGIGKGLYGGGLLVSDEVASRAAAEKAAAEKAAAEKAAAEKAAIVIELSDREQAIVDRLNRKGDNGK